MKWWENLEKGVIEAGGLVRFVNIVASCCKAALMFVSYGSEGAL